VWHHLLYSTVTWPSWVRPFSWNPSWKDILYLYFNVHTRVTRVGKTTFWENREPIPGRHESVSCKRKFKNTFEKSVCFFISCLLLFKFANTVSMRRKLLLNSMYSNRFELFSNALKNKQKDSPTIKDKRLKNEKTGFIIKCCFHFWVLVIKFLISSHPTAYVYIMKMICKEVKSYILHISRFLSWINFIYINLNY
jgi:hypothetical protein